MTWSNRARLAGGLVLVMAVVGAATLHLNDSRSRVESTVATISAEEYVVGTSYAGQLIERLAEPGDVVESGDPMFVVDSATLRRDVDMGVVPAGTLTGDVDEAGNLVVRAAGDGTVTEVAAEVGTFVRDQDLLASVQRAGTLYVEAEYVLTTEQYARLAPVPQATIVLPDGKELAGEVTDLSVRNEDGRAQVVMTVSSNELVDASVTDRLVADGTPVSVRLELTNDGLLTDLTTAIRDGLDGMSASVGVLAGGGS